MGKKRTKKKAKRRRASASSPPPPAPRRWPPRRPARGTAAAPPGKRKRDAGTPPLLSCKWRTEQRGKGEPETFLRMRSRVAQKESQLACFKGWDQLFKDTNKKQLLEEKLESEAIDLR